MVEPSPLRRFFVSYSRQDEKTVSTVIEFMRITGAPVFRDRDGIRPGQKWRAVLDQSIADADAIVVFWSEAAKESEEVRNEWRLGIERGKDIIPVLLDQTPLDPSLSEYQFIDLGSIVRVGHPWEDILEELADLIRLRVEEAPVRLELGILAPDQGFGNVAQRPMSDLLSPRT
jgi:TIR domain